jgi:hypothetical protein
MLNGTRHALGLKEYAAFDEITSDPQTGAQNRLTAESALPV